MRDKNAARNMPRNLVATARVEKPPDSEPGPMSLAADEAGWLAKVASGDAAAFRTLLDRHLGSAVSIARRMLRDEAEAEDVAQEAFLRLWRGASTLDVGPAGVKPWLRRVVSNLCIDRVRGRVRLTVVEELPEVPEDPRQLAALEQKETRQRVDRALKKLPERQRLALTLFHYEGLSQIEVGETMGISDEAVESLLGRARRQLKQDLQSEWRAMLDDPQH